MKTADVFPSKYLTALEIVGKRIRVVIDRVESEKMADGEYKPVVYFHGKEKGVVLNKTNWTTLVEEYGDESDDWTGKSIVLATWKTKNPQGKIVDGILINVLSGNSGLKAALIKPAVKTFADAATENPAADLDDEIPF